MLTPGVVQEKPEAKPMAGSNDAVWGKTLDPIEKFKRDSTEHAGGFMSQILAKERELAKLRIRRSGENARNVIEIGDIHFLNKNFTKARDAYARAITFDRNSTAPYRKLINCYIALGNFEEARKTYERLIQINPTPEFKHEYILLRLTLNIGDRDVLDELGKEIKQLAKENSSNTQILTTYGLFLGFIFDKPESAKEYFEKAILLDVNNFHAINNLGVVHKSKKEFNKALEKFKRAVEIYPKYDSGYENIASVHIDQQNFAAALDALQAGVAEGAQLSETWTHKIGWLYIVLEQYDKAVTWHKKKIKEEYENDFLLNNLGFCYQQQGRLEKAEEYYTKSIECFEAKLGMPNFIADTRSINPYRNLMVLAEKRDKNEQVDETAKRLLRLDPANPMGLYFRGHAQQKMKHYTFAKECFKKSIEGNPNVFDPYINLAFIYEAIDRDYQKAIDVIENAPISKLDHPLVANNLAYAYVKNGDIDQAKALLAKSKFKKHPSLNATKGLIELYENNFKKAETYYNKAIESIDYKEKKSAEQVWAYEQAYFWFKNKDYDQAKVKVKEAIELGDVSYAYRTSKELQVKLKLLGKK